MGDFLGVGDRLGQDLELGDDGFGGLHDAALQRDRVGSGGHVAEAFLVDGFGQHGRRGGAVAGDVRGLGGDFADELRAHVFIGALEFDFLGHRDTVLGDGGGTVFLVDDDIASSRPEGGFDGAGEFFHAAEQGLAGGFVELELFGHGSVR